MGVGSNSSSEALQKGSVILLVLFVSAVFAVLAPVAGTLALSEARIARSHAVQNTALYIAEAGLELAIARLRTDSAFTTPANTPITGTLNGGSFSVSVTAGMGSERIITATGNWGGGQQRVAARATFSQAPLQTFLFQHTLLSGGHTKIKNSTVRGPVRVLNPVLEGDDNLFDQGQPVPGPFGPSQTIPPVDFGHYERLAGASPSLWHVVYGDDLDAAIRAANNLIPRRERILIYAGNKADLSLKNNDPPINFSGLIVIQARTVNIDSNINYNSSNPLVVLTTGDIKINPGQGNSPNMLGNSTLLYSSGTVVLTRSEGGGKRQMTGIIVARQGGGSPRALWNADLAYNNAMLPLLEQDAQPDFRQTQAAGTGMNVTFINPQP
jgi:hypothetical protein